MECLFPPVNWLLLLLIATIAAGQTGFRHSRPTLINPEGIPPTGISRRDPRDRTTDRRSLFFPPADRLSPTRRPILPLPGNAPRNQVTPPVAATVSPRLLTTVVVANNNVSNDADYYEYYDDYYYDLINSTNGSEIFYYDDITGNKVPNKIAKPKPTSLSSRFAATSLRFTPEQDRVTPPRSRVPPAPRPTPVITGVTSSPFRFRFGSTGDRPSVDRERETRPSLNVPRDDRERRPPPLNIPRDDRDRRPQPFNIPRADREREKRPPSNLPRASSSSGSLADLIAKLSTQAEQEPGSNDLDSNRKARILNRRPERLPPPRPNSRFFSQQRPVLEDPTNFRVRVTNSTESTFVVASIQASHSLKVDNEDNIDGTTPFVSLVTERTIVDKHENIHTPLGPRDGNERRFESSPLHNLPTGETRTHRFENENLSRFANITIAVNPTLFNSTIDQISTEKTPVKTGVSVSTTRGLPTSVSSVDNLFNSLPKEDVSGLLPPGYSAQPPTDKEPVIQISPADISKFLPPGFKFAEDDTDTIPELPASIPVPVDIKAVDIKPSDISRFLPPGFKFDPEEEEKDIISGIKVENVDISKFLPKNFKSQPEATNESNPKSPILGVEVKNVDIASFLPAGFTEKDTSETTTVRYTTKILPSGIVFPKRPVRPTYLTTTTLGPRLVPLRPKIVNLFDRVKALATTEFVNPILTTNAPKVKSEGAKEEAATTTTTERTTTTTRRTTTLPPRPTTPGVCSVDCRLAASLRIISGADWKPELANRDTIEFQELANEIEVELTNFFKRGSMGIWFDYVEVDSFNPGSVIVSYILHLKDIHEDLDTMDLKDILNSDLSVVGYTFGELEMDPKGTDFIVMPEHHIYVPKDEQNFLIPEWLIAVIVIGLASFLFILIFGIVALVSRAKNRKRTNPPLTEEILNNLNALQHVGGLDNYAVNGIYGMDTVWNEKMLQEKALKIPPPSSTGKGYNPEYNVNIYDSWRTDYSDPYSSSANNSRRRPELDMDDKQFYTDDPYNF